MEYPVRLEHDDNDTILVSFPDFPEAHTFGDDREEALACAHDALATVIDAYIKDKREIPAPSRISSARTVSVPALTWTKMQLYQVMRHGDIGKAQLAKRLNWHLPQVDRLLDVHHRSRLDQLEAAFSVLGKRIVVSVENMIPESRRRHRTAPRTGRQTSVRRERAAVRR